MGLGLIRPAPRGETGIAPTPLTGDVQRITTAPTFPPVSFILAPPFLPARIRARASRFHPMSDPAPNATIEQLGEIFRQHDSFVIMSHVRPDGDAIGSQIGLGFALMAAGKKVRLINEDGLPESLAFLPGSEKIETPPAEPID